MQSVGAPACSMGESVPPASSGVSFAGVVPLDAALLAALADTDQDASIGSPDPRSSRRTSAEPTMTKKPTALTRRHATSNTPQSAAHRYISIFFGHFRKKKMAWDYLDPFTVVSAGVLATWTLVVLAEKLCVAT